MALKEQAERFVMFPFSLGCTSQSSIAVVGNQPKKAQSEQNSIVEDGVCRRDNRTKTSSLFVELPRPNIFAGLQRFAKGLKMLANLFWIYGEDSEEEEMKMEIGYPTDVQHVAHIGWDGVNNLAGTKSWEKAPEIFPVSSLSLKQFELAMASQMAGGGPLRAMH